MLINGVKRTNGFFSTTPLRKRREAFQFNTNNERLPSFGFDNFHVTSYDHVGEVQCAIFDPDRMSAPVLSNSTFANFRGMVLNFLNY